MPLKTSSWRRGLGVLGAMVALGCGGGESPLPRTPARLYAGKPPSAPSVQLSVFRSPRVHPPEPDRLKEIRLDATLARVDLGAQGTYAGYAFGGQIPGPTVRVRVGDRITFTVANRTNEPIEALKLAGAPTSLEMGGVILDRDDANRTIAPGQTLVFEATAIGPGVHLYRGAVPNAAEAVASGLYGMLIVDPVEGFATRADREYAVVQGELYARPDPAGSRLDKTAVQLLDREALAAKQPTHLGYGGRFVPANGLRLPAEAGERVRLFVVNGGVHTTARFQVEGVQPALLPPGQGAIVELVVPKKGRFRFGDQELGDRGLVGLIDAAQGEPETPLVAVAPRTPAERRDHGRDLFAQRCVSCHEPPAGMMRMAPDLTGIMQRRSRAWLVKWLTDPPKMLLEDPVAQQLLREWKNIPMPAVKLSPEQIEYVLEFLGAPPAKKS
jgi:nitrite reductase (NO-forming)